jgi:hypothetical protein
MRDTIVATGAPVAARRIRTASPPASRSSSTTRILSMAGMIAWPYWPPAGLATHRHRFRRACGVPPRRARAPMDPVDDAFDPNRCHACGSTELAGFVQHGSYMIGCARCGADLVATSWIAVAEQSRGPLRAVVVDARGLPEGEPLEGDASVGAGRIGELAARGLRLRLQPSSGADDARRET